MTPQLFTIKLNIQPNNYLKLNGLDARNDIDRQPAGLNFYKKHWPSDNRGTVFIDHGVHGFQLKNILHATGVEDTVTPEKGIKSYNLNGGGAAQSLDLHDDVRQRFMTFLSELEDKGWKRMIYYSAPRLTGDDATRYLLEEDSTYTPPENYELSLSQWMQLDEPLWQFYVDGVYLGISFKRDRKRMDPEQQGSYLFSYEIYGADEMGASQMQPADRVRWKELWVETVQSLKKHRYLREAVLQSKGYSIDTSYDDPKIHPADPVEP
ncbi:MAG: hypothetical protein ACRBCI_07075 [Cellvibrionaceae bacterium]